MIGWNVIILRVTRICIVPEVSVVGGMASFRRKFEAGLAKRGIEVVHDARADSDAILIIAGTKNLLPLWQKRRSTRIVQRLDGINWIHRRRNTGIRHYLRAEYGNFVLSLIRARITTRVLYQSTFSRQWWEAWYGKTRVPWWVVHNGVDLDEYRPTTAKNGRNGGERCRILIVEGSLGGGYDMGLDNGVQLAETLTAKKRLPTELVAVGKIDEGHRAAVEKRAQVPIRWAGVLGPSDVIAEMQRADLLFSADLHPACPNSVIEAMACGLPVVAFDTGAVRELVTGDAGRVVAYGGDPWKVEPPDIPALAEAAGEMLRDAPHFRAAARAEAEEHLGLDAMVDGYLKALLED